MSTETFKGVLPNGEEGPEHETILAAYYAACRLTWPTDMQTYQVIVFRFIDGEPQFEVPSYEYCDRCNYDTHTCPACGDAVPHNGPGACEPCLADFIREESERAEAHPAP